MFNSKVSNVLKIGRLPQCVQCEIMIKGEFCFKPCEKWETNSGPEFIGLWLNCLEIIHIDPVMIFSKNYEKLSRYFFSLASLFGKIDTVFGSERLDHWIFGSCTANFNLNDHLSFFIKIDVILVKFCQFLVNFDWF